VGRPFGDVVGFSLSGFFIIQYPQLAYTRIA